MTKSLTEFQFDLKEPVTIHKDGEAVAAHTLILKAPSNRHRSHIIKLRQGYSKAENDFNQRIMSYDIKKIQDFIANQDIDKEEKEQKEQKEEKKQKKIESNMILETLYSSNIDMNCYVDVFKKLLCDGVCFIEGNIKLTEHLFNQIGLDDCDELLGKYVEVFMISSWTKR